MFYVQVTYLWCEIYIRFVMNGLCSSDLPMVRDWVTYPWSEKYLGFFIDGLCLGDYLMVYD